MTLSDYFERITKDGYFVDEALVLGPYISSHFFSEGIFAQRTKKKAKAQFPKSRLTIIADQSWDDAQLNSIEAVYSGARCKHVLFRAAPRTGAGLVHVKLYWFSLKRADGRYTKQHLLLGSANASKQGFGTNAESYIGLDVGQLTDQEVRASLRKYLSDLQKGKSIGEALELELGGGVWVSLPALKIRKGVDVDSFDAWLLRGRLCHQFQHDGTFGVVVLNLQKTLPRQDWVQALQDAGFGERSGTSTLAWHFAEFAEDRQDVRPKWKSQYFLETYYGHWASAECFRDKRGFFSNPRKDERKNLLDRIAGLGDSEMEENAERFLKVIEKAIERLGERGLGSTEIQSIFKHSRGVLDEDYYRARAIKKMGADRALAKNEDFRQRYMSGHIFPRVPQLLDEFDDFALSWCASALLHINRTSTTGKLPKAIREAVGNGSKSRMQDWTDEDLLDWLRNAWKTDEKIRRKLLNYSSS